MKRVQGKIMRTLTQEIGPAAEIRSRNILKNPTVYHTHTHTQYHIIILQLVKRVGSFMKRYNLRLD